MTLELSRKPSDYRTFVLYTGYVESSSNGPLIVSHSFDVEEEEETWQAAWEKMFLHFKGIFTIAMKCHNGVAVEGFEDQRDISYCCRKVLDDKEIAYCAKCGTPLNQYREKDIDPDILNDRAWDFIDYIKGSTANSFNYELWQIFQANGWDCPGQIKGGLVSTIYESADKLLGDYEGTKEHSVYWEDYERRGLGEKRTFWTNVHFGRYEDLGEAQPFEGKIVALRHDD
jgi:hypothetical protein